MKKLSVVVLVLLMVNTVVYGYEIGNWEDNGSLPETWTSDCVGIGTDEPEQKLHIKATYAKMVLESNGGSKWWLYARPQDGSLRFSDLNGGGLRMYIGNDGNIGIGTTDPAGYKLAVNGKIRAKEIKIETGWSDFVFEADYKLMPLDKLERHIIANKSLPDIPTEKEVLAGGVNLGEMQSKLLEKIEELTLYVINQDKELRELRKENRELKTRISALEN